MSTAFIQGINTVIAGEQPNSYRVEVNVIYIHADGVNSSASVGYEAPWGSDWKLLAKQAVLDYSAAGIEPPTRIVFSDFSYA